MNLETILREEMVFGFGRKKEEKKQNNSEIYRIVSHLKAKNPQLSDEEALRIATEIEKKQEVPENPSRRNFLKKAGLFGLGMLASTLPFPKSAYAITEKEIKELPPGIAEAAKRDWALAVAEAYWNRDGWESVGNWTFKSRDIATNILLPHNLENVWVPLTTKKESMYREPAFYYLLAKFDMVLHLPNEISNKLKRNNPGLYYFSEGIYYFMYYWFDVGKEKGIETSTIEEFFLKSIITSCGYDLSYYQEYIKHNYEERDKKQQEFTLKLKKRDFFQKLNVAWASFFLTNLYDMSGFGPEGDLIYKNLENPSAKMINHKIRGPPYYGLSNKYPKL